MLIVLLAGLVFGGVLTWRWLGAPATNEQINGAGVVSGPTRVARPLSGAQAQTGCSTFEPRLSVLKERFSTLVGDPVECAHASIDNGDLVQRTTTGLAMLRTGSGVPIFTNGVEHWALTTSGVRYWLGSSIDPPADAQPLEPSQQRATAQPTLEPNRAQVANTEGTGVVLRASPNDRDWTPRGFMDGTQVTILQRQGADWAYVRGDNGQEGWIPARYLSGQ